MGNYVLSIDCGTQSVRGIIFSKKGEMLCKSKKAFEPYYSIAPGYAEQDPLVYWENICFVTNELMTNHKEMMMAVKSIVLTAQRDTCVLVDKNGDALRPAISWADQRILENKRKFSTKTELAMRATGMSRIAHNLSDQCPAHWLQDHEPATWKKTHKYLLLSGYLNHKMTGEFKDSIANQIGHVPLNYKKFRWETKGSIKRDIFQIEDEKLVDLVQTGDTLGYLTEKAMKEMGIPKSLKVIAGGSDKGCETIGVGCASEDVVSISFGSQASVQTTSKKYFETLSFIPPFPAVMPNRYNPEIQVYRGYWMITWFKKEFGLKEVAEAKKLGILPEEILDQKISQIPPGSEGLLLLPYWGAGIKSPEAKGAILGFSDVHTHIHIYRAIVEGIGFAILEGMKKIEKKSGVKIKRVMLSGGGSTSDQICQITADMYNLPVCRVQTYETSSLGASIIGYVENGTYSTYEEAIEAMVHLKDVFHPNEKNVKIYKRLFEDIYKKSYGHLKPIYKSLFNIIDNNK